MIQYDQTNKKIIGEARMKTHLSLLALCLVAVPAFGAGRSMVGTARPVESRSVVMAPQTAASSIKQDNGAAAKLAPGMGENGVSVVADTAQPAKNTREKERLACISNNVGFGNTFVWASRLSNSASYSTMVEDTEKPENNVCFVRVELKSNDQRINISDMQGQYFPMGTNITCGSWIDEEKLKQRILDAKKSARTWATVGGAVGGAAIGVGSMELFGNKLIGGAVQGQKALKGTKLMQSQLLVLKKDNASDFKKIIAELKSIKAECDKLAGEKPETCTRYDYEQLISTENAK